MVSNYRFDFIFLKEVLKSFGLVLLVVKIRKC
ncbi:hypothetical protein HPPC_06350 [Helicobacter pylori PeCan4]|nr:hypothetical protein HPPC_06350 [Helicobacter pylori PeCan4]